MNDLITIDGIELRKKKYENKIIMTSWDIAKMHERDVKDVNQNFKRHQEKFILGLDFFVIPRDKISETQIVIQEFIPKKYHFLQKQDI